MTSLIKDRNNISEEEYIHHLKWIQNSRIYISMNNKKHITKMLKFYNFVFNNMENYAQAHVLVYISHISRQERELEPNHKD